MHLLRIVPPKRTGDYPLPANGTQVFTSDGHKVGGIKKIELTAEHNGIWTARITCCVSPPEEIDGVLVVDESDISDTESRYRVVK